MLTLNRRAAELLRETGGVHAATDVTGFSLLGHGSEIASKSEVNLAIQAGSVPLLPGVLDYAAGGNFAGGLGRNRSTTRPTPGACASRRMSIRYCRRRSSIRRPPAGCC
jgi:selenide,water dikinase